MQVPPDQALLNPGPFAAAQSSVQPTPPFQVVNSLPAGSVVAQGLTSFQTPSLVPSTPAQQPLSQGVQLAPGAIQVIRPPNAGLPQPGSAPSGQQIVTLPNGQQALVRYTGGGGPAQAPPSHVVQLAAPPTQQLMTVQVPMSTPNGAFLQNIQVPVQQMQPQLQVVSFKAKLKRPGNLLKYLQDYSVDKRKVHLTEVDTQDDICLFHAETGF